MKATQNMQYVKKYVVGDLVLGKVRGFPPCPGIVQDDSDLPPIFLNEKPLGREHSVESPFHCIMFFPKGDYQWLTQKDLAPLLPYQIDAFLADDSRKRCPYADIREGYVIARDPWKWMQELHERREKLLRQHELEENAQANQVEPIGDGDGGDQASKKRQCESDTEVQAKAKEVLRSEEEAGKPNKRRREQTHGANRGELEDGSEAHRAADEGDLGPSKEGAQPAAKKLKHVMDHDGDDSEHTSDSDPVKVCHWGFKLQKPFLSNNFVPTADARAMSSLVSLHSPQPLSVYTRSQEIIQDHILLSSKGKGKKKAMRPQMPDYVVELLKITEELNKTSAKVEFPPCNGPTSTLTPYEGCLGEGSLFSFFAQQDASKWAQFLPPSSDFEDWHHREGFALLPSQTVQYFSSQDYKGARNEWGHLEKKDIDGTEMS
ncbi:hypothetical protein NLJ89_g977 [Agrocybe chaxingu]|uniref:PWWP domain-containing protein n=1 Tax=Agrocybe chaxingu TaxID=84603 RepID=A0A9W8TE23_9AGAR|nr:hypothetical protein NLJ89_g977 [Agrocybe chaxingu]